MPSSHKTVISFGLVAIPVEMHTATQDNDIHFNQLHKEDGARVRYKKTCAHCGRELGPDDIVKGYQFDNDRYVIITDEDLEKIKTQKEKTISILHFAKLDQISPVYYDRTYRALPSPGGEKAFELLREALMAEQKIAIGKTVMGTKETLMALIPREDGLLISTMFFSDDIKEMLKTYDAPAVVEQELNLARLLINSMETPFDPSAYKDEYQEKLRALIQTKIDGNEVTAPAAQEAPANVISLMDALKASIEQKRA